MLRCNQIVCSTLLLSCLVCEPHDTDVRLSLKDKNVIISDWLTVCCCWIILRLVALLGRSFSHCVPFCSAYSVRMLAFVCFSHIAYSVWMNASVCHVFTIMVFVQYFANNCVRHTRINLNIRFGMGRACVGAVRLVHNRCRCDGLLCTHTSCS